ncbi:hypothetical protein TNCV_203121 [Trichonephila clavipes]|nr:hypothetical protein TNCV_203121 [Trichonephila clavipes]
MKDLKNLNLGQVTRMTPELVHPLQTSLPPQKEDSSLDRFNVFESLYMVSLLVPSSNSYHAGHESVGMTTRLPRPSFSILTFSIWKWSSPSGWEAIKERGIFLEEVNEEMLTSQHATTRGLLVTHLVILNHGQVTRTTPELNPF